jgi:type IV pilus assembly protein PilY1
MKLRRMSRKNTLRVRNAAVVVCLAFAAGEAMLIAVAANPTLNISQVPLALTTPVRPQVLIAVGNSESMDGTLSGAIMTGSGSLTGGVSSLSTSSSPVSYTVPTGFTPPLQAADGSGLAPYTVTSNGNLVDNGASRLNVAKGGVQAILQSYMQNTDFALETYQISNTSAYVTWVYYMSPSGGNFVFTGTQAVGNHYVANPCFNYSSASATVNSNCSAIASANLVSKTVLASSAYMQIGASSDDPAVNDVLYAFNEPGVYFNYGTPSPPSPFPPYYSLANYNNGSVFVNYPAATPSANTGTSPTNAGFVPSSQQVVYAQRGFGYGGSQAANSGTIAVPMTSSGSNPTTSSVANAINQFTPLLQPETNNGSSGEIKAAAGQSPTAGLLSQAKTYLTSAGVNAGGSCAPKQYVVLISDGLPTEDLSGRFWPPLGSASATGYGVSATFNNDGSLGATNDQALTDTIAALTALSTAGIKTFIVGLGAGVDPTVNPQAAATLQAMAIAGGTANYYPASSPAALVNDLNSILISVQNGSLSTTASAVNSTHLQTGAVEYQANFVSSDTPFQDWTGELFAKALDPATGAPTGAVLWSARASLDAKVAGSGWSTSRVVATWNPTLNLGGGGGAPFEWSNGNPALAISASQQGLLQPSDTRGQVRLSYLRGDKSNEVASGGAFRNRSHALGDIVDSQPIYVGAPSGPYVESGYFNYQQNKASRQPMLYVGANDGMLHAFNALTGAEQFAFIPNGVFATLTSLTAPLYNQSHRFLVDGSPQSADVKFSDGSWHTMLVGGENGGGKTIYAIDVSNPASLTTEAAVASAVMWEFSDSDMGLSYSEPQIASIAATPGFAVFFGNGFNSSSNHAILYAINPQTGQTLRKIDLCTAPGVNPNVCSSGSAEGLSTVSVGNSDGVQSNPITQVYAGDLQGNMWAVDVSSADPANWTVRLLFQARDSSGNPQSITTAPVVTLNPQFPRRLGLFVIFGTGQFLTPGDVSSLQTHSAYGVWDNPGGTGSYNRSNLQVQTLSLVTVATSHLPQDILTDTNNNVNFATVMGWYTDFPTGGQRVFNAPQLLNGSFIATLNTPPSSQCGIPAVPMLLELNFASGGSFMHPQLDINNNLIINSSDTYKGTNPVGISLGTPGYGSSPTILGPNGSNQMVKNITLSSGQQKSVINPNNGSRSAAFWQIQ